MLQFQTVLEFVVSDVVVCEIDLIPANTDRLKIQNCKMKTLCIMLIRSRSNIINVH